MNRLVRGLGTSIGLKFLMGLTGLVLFLFLVGHLAGNLQLFAGPDRLNTYAATLQSLGPGLWVIRAVLLAVLVTHVACAVRLTSLAKAARPSAYAMKVPLRSTYASRTMLMTGLVVLAFLLYHLAHFTLGMTDPADFHLLDAAGRHDVHAMVVRGFRSPLVALSYMVAMGFLGLHLFHGVASFFQSLGWNHRRYKAMFAVIARTLAFLVVVGNILMPLVILVGIYPSGGSAS